MLVKVFGIEISQNVAFLNIFAELEKSNPEIRTSLEQHLVPKEAVEGLYDEFYSDFLEERAEKMFDLVKKYVVDVREQIVSDFYPEQIAVDSVSGNPEKE